LSVAQEVPKPPLRVGGSLAQATCILDSCGHE
jgi:hypothetical protein